MSKLKETAGYTLRFLESIRGNVPTDLAVRRATADLKEALEADQAESDVENRQTLAQGIIYACAEMVRNGSSSATARDVLVLSGISTRKEAEETGASEEDITTLFGEKEMTPEEFIAFLAEVYAEKRSDVAELCADFLKGRKNPSPSDAEHRYIRATIPANKIIGEAIEVEYDTLTTEIAYKMYGPMQWEQCIHHKYYDNIEEIAL